MPRARGDMPLRKPENMAGTLKRLFGYIFRNYRLSFAAVIVCILLSALGTVAMAFFYKTLIDDYVKPLMGMADPDFSRLLAVILFIGGVFLLSLFANWAYQRLMITVSQGVLTDIRKQLFAKMQKLPLSYFDRHSHGDLMSRFTSDTDTLRQFLETTIPQLLSSVVSLLSVLVSMFILSVPMTFVMLAGAAVMIFIMGKVTGKSGKYFHRQQESLGKLNGYIEEMIHGQKVVKVFCHEEATRQEFDVLNKELCENATRANQFANILMPIMGNLGHLMYAVVAMVGGTFAAFGIGSMTLGDIAAFLQLTRSFYMPISNVSQQVNFVVMAAAGAERIFRLMDELPEEDAGDVMLVCAHVAADGSITEATSATGKWAWKLPLLGGGWEYRQVLGDVRMEHVDFGYVPEKTVLHDVTLYAKPGQKVAFVGATGAGKTTITNLINRFYDTRTGSITYDGIPIGRIKKADLRSAMALVLQDVHLFTGTVMENIRYGKPDATDAEVIAGAKLANAHDFIMRLPEGYNTMLEGDGGSLSQGQRQLLSIARAAVCDPPVMILDEATSSIDTRTERLVQDGMDSLMRGRTVFVIAHRLSTVKNANVIMVLEKGRIIERGTHQELLALKGKYYHLYTGAFELE